MKKIFSLLLALPLMFTVASCDDDNNLPDVDVSVKYSGAVSADGALYVVQGNTLSIDAIDVINREHGKTALITSASYSWDYRYAGLSITPPYGMNFVLTDVAPGPHLLQVECPLYAVDKSPATLYFAYKVIVVENEDQLPTDDATPMIVHPGIKAD